MENSTSLFNKVVYVCSVRGTEALTFTTVHFIKAARRCLSLANVKPHHALTAWQEFNNNATNAREMLPITLFYNADWLAFHYAWTQTSIYQYHTDSFSLAIRRHGIHWVYWVVIEQVSLSPALLPAAAAAAAAAAADGVIWASIVDGKSTWGARGVSVSNSDSERLVGLIVCDRQRVAPTATLKLSSLPVSTHTTFSESA